MKKKCPSCGAWHGGPYRTCYVCIKKDEDLRQHQEKKKKGKK